MSQQGFSEYLAHGQTPFFRLPVAPVRPGASAHITQGHVVLLGAPFDGGATYQAGARFAPYEVRLASAPMAGFHPHHGVEVFKGGRVIDGGNVPLSPFSAEGMRETMQVFIREVSERGGIPLVCGGDHSVSLPILRALHDTHGPLAVLHIDAHFDTSTDEVYGDAYHHGTPIRHALSEGLIAKGALVQVGMRGPFKDADEPALSRRHGAHIFTMVEVEAIDLRDLVRDVRHALAGLPLYISIDVDGLDPSFAPGTGTPVQGGLTTREVMALLRGLSGLHLIGGDVVEISPPIDHARQTSRLGAALLFELAALATLSPRSA